jgi:hypothetical protein
MIGKTMTAPGRRRKLCPLGLATSLLVAVALAGVASMQAATTERVVVDRATGLALSGYDPVAYFIEGRATPGRGDLEYAFAGGVWRFRNEGNRAAFMTDPHVYMPRFGGYDPVGLARGVAVAGDPRLWFLAGERLYLFYSIEDQAAFVVDAERMIATADRKWPSIQQQLVH